MKAFLRICAEIEATIEQVYQLFARKSEGNPELVKLWRQLAQDEFAHTQQLQLAERMLKPDIAQPNPNLPTDKAQKMLDQVKAFLAKAEDAPLSELDCLKASIRLEKDFMVVHLDNSLQLIDPGLRQMFGALARDDEAHFDLLRAYVRKHDELFDI